MIVDSILSPAASKRRTCSVSSSPRFHRCRSSTHIGTYTHFTLANRRRSIKRQSKNEISLRVDGVVDGMRKTSNTRRRQKGCPRHDTPLEHLDKHLTCTATQGLQRKALKRGDSTSMAEGVDEVERRGAGRARLAQKQRGAGTASADRAGDGRLGRRGRRAVGS